MHSYAEWATAYPAAAAALATVLAPAARSDEAGASEARAQQAVRLAVSRQGGYAWRNNVGATPARCKHCHAEQTPVRYGLANESAALNKHIKSSDLILAIPRTIRPADVGGQIAQFGAVEVKRPGWTYTGQGREAGQSAWLALIASIGGYARFTTGDIEL